MLAINGSPRSNGHTSRALNVLLAEAEVKGYEVERIDLVDLDYSDCKGCRSCKTEGSCIIDDDMSALYDKIKVADHILLSSPIYMGSETGIFNCFIDRLYAFLEYKEGGGFTSRLPAGKSATAILICGSPDGHIIYHYLTNRFTSILKGLLGIEDFASFIIPGTNKLEDVMESVTFKQNIPAFIERL